MDPRATVEAVWKLESARIVAALTRLVRDVGLAEDLAQDALLAALEEWPVKGTPPNPGGWLMLTAKHRAIDRLRRDDRLRANLAELGRAAEQQTAAEEEFDDGTGIDDDVLRLIFIACHPVLSRESSVALTLRMIGGLTTAEIARAFLVPEPTIGQRISRAKRTLGDRKIPFEVPPPAERAARLAAVLETIYLIFNEGYAATAGDDWMRPALAEEAVRLGRMLAGLAPGEAEVHGLVALMELHASRMPARLGPDGAPVPLLEQDRGRWDQTLIRSGFASLLRADRQDGPYVLQAAIAASHAQARQPGDTDWVRIAGLYELLVRQTPTPVVELNRAVAVAMAFGPERGLEIVDRLAEPLRDYHLLPAVRGDLLRRLGRDAEARAEFARAADLARNTRERDVLLERAGM
ncbi:RNA polymerase sigma factor (sigma-70 family) [Asanoa ferruginea]|uniref:RNA polymerase sigma factor (Sigma-70 family) n=1 Tax=Asanoa ferruginea TaxID=53367 RepID=A0A3D9ZJ00_9ACTN|nr:sigma-70 family RNA polymerase sigma factor [Asanoa ferruginea]REF97358.1 RNA polymerase sigma factor (sigma-70 family) [Asanoa ferruginea]GIF51177.1 RNA polymerase sigma factor [Asanoa ferruginea]